MAGDGRIGHSAKVSLPAANKDAKAPRSVESLVTPGSNGVIREVTQTSGPALEKRINQQFVDAVLLTHPKDPKKSIQVLGNFDDSKIPQKGETLQYQGMPVKVLKRKTEINTEKDLANLERTEIKEGIPKLAAQMATAFRRSFVMPGHVEKNNQFLNDVRRGQ